jgi:hypothetical protein
VRKGKDGNIWKVESTMNLSEDLSVDKELFSGVYEGKYI